MKDALVLVSIVLGVAITFELEHLSKVLRSKKVRWHWAQPLFAIFVLLSILMFWWSAVNWANGPDGREALSLGEFIPLMVQMVLLALLAAASFPDTVPEEGLDLAQYYQDNRVYQWSLFLIFFGLIHAGYVIRTARSATSLADMWVVVPDTVVICLFSLMLFARKWWQVGLGFAVFSFVPVVWATLTLR
jgi:phosphatidylglycerophosphatase A